MQSALIYVLVQRDCAAKARMPLLYLLDIQVASEGPQTRDISLPWNNSQIDAARRTFLDRHPLAKNKEQVALAKGEGRAPLLSKLWWCKEIHIKTIFLALTLQVLTLLYSINRVDKVCHKQGVILQTSCKPCNASHAMQVMHCGTAQTLAHVSCLLACLVYASIFTFALSPACPSSSGFFCCYGQALLHHVKL